MLKEDGEHWDNFKSVFGAKEWVNYSAILNLLPIPLGKCSIQWAFIPTWKLCPLRALWVPVAFVPNWKLDQSLERPMCCLSGPNKSELGHLKDLCQTLLKIISNLEKDRPKQKQGTKAKKKPMPRLHFIQSSCLVELCLQLVLLCSWI